MDVASSLKTTGCQKLDFIAKALLHVLSYAHALCIRQEVYITL